MITTEKKYIKAASVDEALQLAAEHNDSFRFLAGGTDVIVNKFQDNDDATCLIDLTAIKALQNVIVSNSPLKASSTEYLSIGSLITLDDLNNYDLIRTNFPTLLEAAHQAASPMLRKTATIGGNILCENRCSFYNQSEWWRTAIGYCLK